MTIFNNIWQYLISDNIWQYLTIFDNIWQYLTISDNILQYFTIFDIIWQFQTQYIKSPYLQQDWSIHDKLLLSRKFLISPRQTERFVLFVEELSLLKIKTRLVSGQLKKTDASKLGRCDLSQKFWWIFNL